jgi:Amt family ammonium transporter
MEELIIDSVQAIAAVVETVAVEATPVAEASTVSIGLFTANNVWMMVCTALVFIMHLGFATLETGLTRAKNSVNILFKNVMTPSIGLLTFYVCGFNLMYPGDFNIIGEGVMGFAGWGIDAPENGMTTEYASGGYTWWTDFIFQGMFAATCATIVSGCVAERIKLEAYLIFTILFVAILYPVVGSWKWGGGFLDGIGFYDFAGSTLVHSVGGWGGLAGILVLGPRIGKFVNGKARALPGHSMPMATIGVFLLWLGWFGFNGGSVLSADPALTSLVLVTTSLAAAAGAISSMIVSFVMTKKHDLSMVLNGVLGGLVGITAGADQMSPGDAITIGLIAGAIVVVAVIAFDKIKIDDPVGALSVHLVCGIFGTLAVGMFGAMASSEQFMIQLQGVAAYGVATFIFAYIVFFILNKTMGIRVPKDHEVSGLDINEHGMMAYSELNDEL